MQEPETVAGCTAGQDVHVTIRVALDSVAVAEKGFQKGADASTELDQMDGPGLGHLGARKVAQDRKGRWC